MSGMAEVLAEHRVRWVLTNDPDYDERMPHVGKHVAECVTCGPTEVPESEHQAAMLSAAGFGPVKEAAAAGVRSIFDIWGAGGRRTVRMEELHKVDASILSGEWDDHIKWNMGDIARERARAARAAAVRDES